MTDLDHEALQQDVAAVALGVAEPERYEAVRAHLPECSDCRELAGRLARAVALLPLEVEDVQPRAARRDRILASAVPDRPARQRLGLRAPALAVAAAFLLAVGFATGLAAGRIGAPEEAPPPATARYTLTGTGSMAGSSARVVSLRGQGVAFVDFTGLPALDASRVYELWLIPTTGQPVPARIFRPEQDGTKVVLVESDLRGYRAMAVTVEPAPNGSPQPTQQPELSGQVA